MNVHLCEWEGKTEGGEGVDLDEWLLVKGNQAGSKLEYAPLVRSSRKCWHKFSQHWQFKALNWSTNTLFSSWFQWRQPVVLSLCWFYLQKFSQIKLLHHFIHLFPFNQLTLATWFPVKLKPHIKDKINPVLSRKQMQLLLYWTSTHFHTTR